MVYVWWADQDSNDRGGHVSRFLETSPRFVLLFRVGIVGTVVVDVGDAVPVRIRVVAEEDVFVDTRIDRVRRKQDREAYLEELIVRRELAVNFVYYATDYDAYRSLPEWARKSLAKHTRDKREHVYTRSQLEKAETHDPYWNAAMREMVHTGFMHNYMRMYWGKKILEWSRTPEHAFRTTLQLNNKYFLDGRDPNSYANVAWCFGQHDRGWAERKIFGKVRYMNDRGLERKFDMDAYIEQVERLINEEG